MRVLIALFSVYLIALALMPCTDMAYSNPSAQELPSISYFQGLNHDHAQGADACSPFCACSCCGATYVPAMIWTSFSFSLKPNFQREASQPNYIASFLPNFLDSIWQPPKLIV